MVLINFEEISGQGGVLHMLRSSESNNKQQRPKLEVHYTEGTAVVTNKNVSRRVISCQNAPNPFNTFTKISYNLNNPDYEKVRLAVYNSSGALVQQLVNEEQKAGNYSYNFNFDNLNSGVYYYQLTVDKEKTIGKMTCTK